MRCGHESIGDGARGLLDERVVIAGDIEDAAGLAVDAELKPGKARKASESSAMRALRSCMELTMRSSVREV